MSEENVESRRNSLKMIGFGAVAAFVAMGAAETAVAQETPALKASMNPRLVSLKLANPIALRAVGLTKRLPATTPITQMLTPSGASALTSTAAQLTKADLVAMSAGRVTGRAAGLTVRDVASIQTAFGKVGGLAAAVDVSCCCCTPCCCAAAVDTSQLLLAA